VIAPGGLMSSLAPRRLDAAVSRSSAPSPCPEAKLRVMAVIDTYRVSGPAKGVLDFFEFARDHLDPLVVVFERGRGSATELQSECARRSLAFAAVWERHRYDLTLVRRALAVARSFRPDLIQTHSYKADLVGLALRWRLGIPWIAFSHGRTGEGCKVRLYHTLDEIIIRGADRVVAVSEARRAALRARGCRPTRLVTIPNAVAVAGAKAGDAAAVRQELGLDAHRPVVAAVGRLSPEKGQSYFVDAMAAVARAVPGAQGLIVGDGQEEGRLRAKVAAMELDGAIGFAGYRRDMDRIYAAIDLLVLPSLSEGLPNVVLEAMAHGRPVIATRVGGVPEVVEDGVSGFLVAPADAHALAQATVTLLHDPVRRASMGAAARERVERGFSVRGRAARILSVYSDVLQRRGPRPRPHRTYGGARG